MLAGGVTTCMFWRALSVNLRLDGGRKGGNRETEIMSLLQVRKHGGLDLSACGRSEERSDFRCIDLYAFVCARLCLTLLRLHGL